MEFYTAIKLIHIATAIASILGFILRGFLIFNSANITRPKMVNIIARINDSILLISAIVLVFFTAYYPVTTNWINAKILLLLLYIILGTIALNRGKTKNVRFTAWILAILTYIYIMMVAITKTTIAI